MHRSHFGSRYTLGCCGYAGLLWGAQFPELAHPCPQGHKDIYAYQVTTVNLGLGWQLLLDHVQTTKADIYHVHSVVLDFGQYSRTAIPVSKHTCCTIFGIFILFLGCLPCFFLQSGSVVLDCGHTPGEHSQCHNTPAAQIQKFMFNVLAQRQAQLHSCGVPPMLMHNSGMSRHAP